MRFTAKYRSDDSREMGRGAVMVELAICLPVIMILMAGMANLGSILWQIQQVSDAARHGARMAAALSNTGQCTESTLEAYASTVATNYINDSHADPMNWWSNPEVNAAASYTINWTSSTYNPTAFSRRGIKVEFNTGGAAQGNNCMICFAQILRKLKVRVQAVFALEACG